MDTTETDEPDTVIPAKLAVDLPSTPAQYVPLNGQSSAVSAQALSRPAHQYRALKAVES